MTPKPLAVSGYIFLLFALLLSTLSLYSLLLSLTLSYSLSPLPKYYLSNLVLTLSTYKVNTKRFGPDSTIFLFLFLS